MRTAKSTGRIVGVLLFVQLLGLMLPFILLMPINAADFLETMAGVSTQIRTAVLLLFANGALTVGIAVAAFPVLRERGYGWALWLLSVSVIWLAMQAVDNAHIMSVLSLSQRYAEGGGVNGELYGALAAAARSSRRWAHYTELLVIDAWFFVFYGLLLRLSLVPRALAGFGLAMAIVHTAAITLPAFLSYGSVQPLGVSLALSHLAVAAWLAWKGFGDGRPLRAEARGVELAGV